jgi:membrane dipeptidase
VETRRKAGIGATGETADIVPFIPDLRGPQQYEKILNMLAQRGMSSTVIDRIPGKNFLRLMDEVWLGH